MRLRGLFVLPIAGCTPAPSTPIAQPAEPTVAAPTAEPIAAGRSRRGECNLGEALAAFVSGQEAADCGELPPRPAEQDYERARACVMAAQRDHAAFKIVWDRTGIDSILFDAVAGRIIGDRYEVRWFSYDSCPSGCGADDPTWSSVRCEPLVDLRAACRALQQRKTPRDDDLCEADSERKTRSFLELRCEGRSDPQVCGPLPRARTDLR